MKKLSLFLVALTMLLVACKPEIEKPTVVTKSVGEVTKTSAKVVGQVAADGGGEVTERGICWSTRQNPTIEDNKTTEGYGVGSFTSQILDLVPNTQYYVRAYATNEAGTSYGEEVSFTTEEEEEPEEPGDEPEEPGDEPEEPGDEPEEPGDEPEEPGDEPEEPGDEPEEPGDEPEEPGDEPEEPGDEPEEPGDEPEEPGDEPEEPEQPEEVAPEVTTSEVTGITVSSATCGGEVLSGGDAVIVARGVCWNTTGTPTISDTYTMDGSNIGTYTSNMTNLEHNTTYYVRAYATNAKGVTGYGEEVSFTTIEKLLPTVTTSAEVTDITVSNATCGGEVTFEGNVSVTARGICWSTSQNPTIEDNKTTDGSGVGFYTSNMTNLEHNTTYYVRAYATNEVGTAYGEEVTFTTIEKLLPTVITTEVAEIKLFSAKCGGEVTFEGNVTVTARGICWSTKQNPTIEDDKTTEGYGVGTFTSNMTNLEHNTTYYVRAYATNEVGTAYGEERVFTTLPIEGTTNGHSWVDLGLPSGKKWATCNVGASSPEGYGDYFAWGETSTKETYDYDNCPTYGLSISELQSQGYIDGEGNLTPQYDAATANWGGDWRMPTKAEYHELLNNCTWEWTTQNSVNGYKVTGPSGASIFLPSAGSREGSSLYDAGSRGNYWSSTPYDTYNSNAYRLYIDSRNRYMGFNYRISGRSVRSVLE